MNKILDARSSGETERRILQTDQNPNLFKPLTIRSVTSRNHIMVSPMCQYSGIDGFTTNWHYVHLGARAIGGAGIVCTEVIHTESRGRITPGCLGLWSDEQRDRLAPIVEFISDQGAIPAAQIGHAGRKGSISRPWEGSIPLTPKKGAWSTISSSPNSFSEGWHLPEELSLGGIDEVIESFKNATRRARQAGFKIIELHGAHGYLINQFYSHLTNTRVDAYGGSFENRCRFLFDVIEAVRSEWPKKFPLFLRVSATDWIEGGWGISETIRLAKLLKKKGQVDLIDCSSGGTSPNQKVPAHPGYQVAMSRQIREGASILTGAVGLIHSPYHAESILANGEADLVIMGRTLLADPHWPMKAAKVLNAENFDWPVQYERGNIF